MPLLIVADDNAYMRWLVLAAFRGRFDEVIEASDGRELFWQLVRCSRTRDASDVVVVTDIRMPECSGLDVLASFDELGYHPKTVLMTSYPDETAYAAAARVGGVLIPKPFAMTELRRVVDQVSQRQ